MVKRRNVRLIFLGLSILLLAGCKEVLYSGLPERDANEMVAILEASGISASRSVDKDGIYSLLVDGLNVGAATTILKTEGFPKKQFKSVGEIFAAEGIVGTPFEERVRYMYALDEKLSEHLTSIDGIRDARVSVSIPEKSRFDHKARPSKASVILHHEEDFQAAAATPKIKTLISNSVEGLEYDSVAIVLFPAGGTKVLRSPKAFPGGNTAEAAGQFGENLIWLSDETRLERIFPVLFIFAILAYYPLIYLRIMLRKLGLRWAK